MDRRLGWCGNERVLCGSAQETTRSISMTGDSLHPIDASESLHQGWLYIAFQSAAETATRPPEFDEPLATPP